MATDATALHMPILGYARNEFTLHNASPNQLDWKWGGRMFTLPPVDIVGPRAAKYDDGEPIPGTLVLEDSWVPGPDGDIDGRRPPNWLAFEAIRNVLGVDPETKQAVGVAAKSGISFLPPKPSRELVAFVLEDGKRRYEESQMVWADSVVAGFQTAIQKCREAGVAPPPPSSDYMKAVTLLEKRKKQIEAQLNAVLPEEAPDANEIEFLAFAKARAMEMATKAAAGKEIDRAALADELLQDPDVRGALQRQYNYRIRKKGYMDVPTPGE